MLFNNIEQIILFCLITLCLGSFTFELVKRFKIVLKGEGSLPFDNLGPRFFRVLSEFFFQSKVLKQRFIPGLMHAFVFWGFIAFSLITIDHFLRGFNTNLFSEQVRLYYSYIFGIPWSLLVLIGILYLAYRRFIKRPKFLGDKVSYTSAIVTFFISVLMITYMLDAYWIVNNMHPTILTFKINWGGKELKQLLHASLDKAASLKL